MLGAGAGRWGVAEIGVKVCGWGVARNGGGSAEWGSGEGRGGGLNELRTDLYKHMEEKRGKKKSLVSAGCETGLIRGVKD